MSGDIAQLGLSVDSRPVTAATAALQGLAKAAGPAAAGANALAAAAANAAGTVPAASVATKAWAAALSGVSAQLIALSAGAGPVGVFLAALGPWGVAAGAGLQLISSAFSYVTDEAARMGQKAIDVRTFAASTGLAIDQISALKRIGATFGVGGDTLTTSFDRLTSGLTDAHRATGPLYDDVQRVNAGLADELQAASTTAEGIDVLAKAYRSAGNEATKASLAKAIFGRGGAALGPVLGAVADSGGLNALTASTQHLIEATTAQNERWAQMQAQIDTLNKSAKNILASIFTDEGLSAALAAAELSERFARSAKDIASQKEGLSAAQRFFTSMAEGSAGEHGIDPEVVQSLTAVFSAQQRLQQGKGLILDPAATESWNQLSDAVRGIEQPMDRAVTERKALVTSTLDLQNAAVANSKTQQDYIAFLGAGASINDKLQAQLANINALYRDHKTGLTGDAAAQDALNRAVAAAGLDAVIQKESLRLGLLGPLATQQEQVAQKQLDINKANQQGASISAELATRILSYTAATALGITQIQGQTDAFHVNAATVGMAVGQSTSYTAIQTKLNEQIRLGNPLLADQVALLQKAADAEGAAAQAAALRSAQSNTTFATAQLGRTDAEAQVATQLRQLYGDDFRSHLQDALAGQIRMNAALGDMKGVAQSAFSGMLQDLRDGKTAGDAFANVLVKLENKLFDIASNQLFSGLLRSAGGLLGGGGGLPTGGSGLPYATNHTGYGPGDSLSVAGFMHPSVFANAPRFHSGVGPGERAAVIRKDESVLTPGQMRALSPAGGGNVTVNLHNAPAGSQADVKQSKDSKGNTQIDMRLFGRMIDDAVATGIRGRESATHSAIKDTFGARDSL